MSFSLFLESCNCGYLSQFCFLQGVIMVLKQDIIKGCCLLYVLKFANY